MWPAGSPNSATLTNEANMPLSCRRGVFSSRPVMDTSGEARTAAPRMRRYPASGKAPNLRLNHSSRASMTAALAGNQTMGE